jgi:negative regulator of flagellin synthesis FlgM
MSSFEIGASSSVSAVQSSSVQQSTAGTPANTGGSTASNATVTTDTKTTSDVQTTVSTSAGTVPVDQDRVDQIRQAVENGTYPLVPTKIGDAMIAAGVMLRRHS